MQRAAEIIGYFNTAAFAGLGLLALRLWARERDATSGWAALTFGTLTVVTVAGLFLPDQATTDAQELATKALVVLLVLFPYCLYRFTTSFSRASRRLDVAALVSLAALTVWTLTLSHIPSEGEERPTSFSIYVIGLLIYWTALSAYSSYRLWKGGQAEPSLTKNRMRLLSLGSIGLNLALIIAGAAPSEGDSPIAVMSALAALSSALFFYFGFAPPPVLRLAWRRPEQEELQRAVVGLMTATDATEVANALLPHVKAVFGGSAAALIDPDGGILGEEGLTEEHRVELARVDGAAPPLARRSDVASVEMPFGSLLVWTSPYTPFFGREDLELLQSMGVLADLALERCRFIETERHQREQLERINEDLAAAQALAQLGSWEWDIKEDKVTWSDELYRIFGVDPGEFDASYDAYIELIHPEDRDMVNMSVDAAYRTGEFPEFEHRILRKDGSLRWTRATGTVIRDETGEPIRMLGTSQDVTERKLAEEYERELQDAAVRQRQALELNDNIVQGLAIAGMALEIGETTKAKDAISKTMAAAQEIITGLLRRSNRDLEVQPGDLVRRTAVDFPGKGDRLSS